MSTALLALLLGCESKAVTGPIAEEHNGTAMKASSPEDCELITRTHVKVITPNHCIVPRGLYFGSDACSEAKPFSMVSGRLIATGIRPGSLHAICGFKNGDEWLRINGINSQSPANILASYGALKGASSLRIDVKRNDEELALMVEFDPATP